MENNNYPDDIVRGLKEQNDTLHAEKERTLKYADEMALKFCEMRNSKDAQLKAQRDLLEKYNGAVIEFFYVYDTTKGNREDFKLVAERLRIVCDAALSGKGEGE